GRATLQEIVERFIGEIDDMHVGETELVQVLCFVATAGAGNEDAQRSIFETVREFLDRCGNGADVPTGLAVEVTILPEASIELCHVCCKDACNSDRSAAPLMGSYLRPTTWCACCVPPFSDRANLP